MQICEKLRTVTHAIHLQLHKHPLLSVLTGSQITVDEIRYIQTALYGFWQPLHITNTTELPVSPITQWLEDDLRIAQIEPTKLAKCEKLPQLNTEEDQLGIAYVREGSLLGGQVIFKNISRLVPQHTHGLSFFVGRGKDTPKHWRAFIECLEWRSQALDQEAICDAALGTFVCFKQWMDHCHQTLPDVQSLSPVARNRSETPVPLLS